MSKGALLDALSSIGLVLLGLFIVWEGVNMGFISQGAPGAGFFPLLMGVGISIFSAINAIRSFNIKNIKLGIDREELIKVSICVASLVIFIILSEYIGMVVGAFVMTMIVGLVYEGLSIKKLAMSAIMALVVSISSWVVFGVILSVPLL